MRRRIQGFLSVALFAFAAFLAPQASSQTGPTEDELEVMSHKLVIEVVSASYKVLRWPPGQFPLHVALLSGEDLKKTACPDQWRRQFEDYLQFMNTKQVLLTPTATADGLFDAYVFYGSREEFQASAPSRLEATWSSRPEVAVQYQILARSSHSGFGAYGTDNFFQFALNFGELHARSIDQFGHCNSVDPAHDLGLALLQGYALDISGRVSVLVDERVWPMLEWRAQRRLLSAMTRLPDGNLGSEQLKSALIEALSNE